MTPAWAEELAIDDIVFLLWGYGLGVVISVVDKLLHVWLPKHVLLLILLLLYTLWLGKGARLERVVSNNLNLELLFF